MFSRLTLVVAFLLSQLYRGLILVKDVVIVYSLYFVLLAPFGLVARVIGPGRSRLRQMEFAGTAWVDVDGKSPGQRKLPRRLFYAHVLPELFRRRKFGRIVLYWFLFHMGRLVAKKNVSPWDQPYVYANF